MAYNPLYNGSLANLYRSIGTQMGVSPAFQNASIAQGIAESSLDPNARGDNGLAMGLHQWHPDRQKNLLAMSQKLGLPPTHPLVQIPFWYNENKANWGISDPRAANDAALASERPAGWTPGNPMGVPSYNKRLGDTLALMRMQTGQPDPNDPRSFQATGSDDMAGPAPAQPDATGTMDLPNNEQTNWGGIGSSLTNLGSIVAGLDKSIGGQLMARNLSNVASNQLREQALNQKDDTPQLLGYNADKSMAMMRRGNQVYSIATPSGFAGKEQPEALKLIDALASDPVRMKAYKDAHGIEDPTEADPDSLKIAGTDYLINGNDSALRAIPQKARPEAIRLAREQYEKDTGEKFDATDLAIRRGDYKTLQAESAKFGQMLAPTQAAHDRLQQDISIAKERIAAIPEQLNKASLPWNQFMQLSSKTLQDKGFSELAKAREAIYNVERGYTNVQANGMRSGDTVTAQNRAESLINSAMTPDTLLGEVGKDGKRSGGLLDFMGDSSTRILQSVKGGQDTLRQEWKSRAKNFGAGINKTEAEIADEIDRRAKGVSAGNTSISTPSQAHINGLRAHPEMRDQFDAKFGPGAAAKILGN